MEDWRGGYGLNLSTNENISLVVGSQIFVIGKALKADFFFFFLSAEYVFTAYPLLACSLRGLGSLMDIYV